YDITIVDTAINGNNPDHLTDSVRKDVQEKIIDTTKSITDKNSVTKNHVAVSITFSHPIPPNPAGTAQDTDYLYQDPNGDLYRYNFGFSILNQFPFIVQIAGGNVDVGWVLAAKLTSSVGTKWVAKTDTVIISGGLSIYLLSEGEMMADTSFVLGTQTIKTRHARNTVTATALGGAPVGETATVILDSYYSTDINAVVCDFFRHVTLIGSQYSKQAQGTFKVMTSYTP
ncbi:MAG: hypothetical protein ACHQM6_08815, partial [Candidatus Kapaibacterium sp.]